MFFSVIVPTHNGAARLPDALSSVTSQTFTDYELIVVCDSCDDNSANIAESFGANVTEITALNDGIARNAGLDIAKGEWILFLDDDDHFLHEYCFQLIADTINNSENPPSVLDFGFICKHVGVMFPAPEKTYVMVWARAWNRNFIGDNRFQNIPYGSDNEFYNRIIADNPNASVAFLWHPIYYYNYMREGSLSFVQSKKKYLDIIITHYDEPWEVGKPFFDMLQHQKCVDYSNISITLIQDGKNKELPWDKLLTNYRYNVNIITLNEHVGTAEARNLGIQESKADWLVFCNFDDMYADVCAMKLIVSLFPYDKCDIFWGKHSVETIWCTGDRFINTVDVANFSSCANKYYNRQFLLDHNVRFVPDAGLDYDYVFNSIALSETDASRVRELTTTNYLYYKSFRYDSSRHSAVGFVQRMKQFVWRDMFLTDFFLSRNNTYWASKSAMRAVCNAYYKIYNPLTEQKTNGISPDLVQFVLKHKDLIFSVSDSDLEVIKDESETETANFIQNLYNETRLEYYFANDEIQFVDWLDMLFSETDSAVKTSSQPVDHSSGTERVVVYCGTRNVYDNMVTAAKSVLCNTPVDKIIFFIEDDSIPNQNLPDIIQCINVSNQQYFPEDSPNYINTWTYMCMIRAAFPELLPSFSRVLSMDIDTIVQEDISPLWNIDLSNAYLAGVPEPQRQKEPGDPLYINFGVVMMNLDKLRADNKQQEIIDILNSRKVDCPEQGAFNEACAGHIIPMPNDYNVTVYSHITGKPEKERILHYAGQRFWKHYASVKKYSDLSWKQVMQKQYELNASKQVKNALNTACRRADV